MQVINETNPGAALGTALGQGLSALAQHKIQQMQGRAAHQQKVQAFQTLGLAPEEASAIASLPEKLQFSLFQGLLDRGSLGQEQQQSPLQQLMQPMKTAPEMPVTGIQALQQAQQPSIQQAIPKAEPEGLPIVERRGKAIKLGKPGEKSIEPIATQPRPALQREVLPAQDQELKAQVAPKKITLKEKLQLPSAKEQARIEKEVAPFVKETTNQSKIASNNDKRLARMEVLTKKGYLGIPLFNTFLRAVTKGVHGVGLDLTSLMTADAQEFEKLSNDFLKDAKEIFGSRITDTDLNAFLKTIPNLGQTNEGRMRVINNLKNFNAAAKAKKQAMDEIIEENSGRKPSNLETLVEKRAAPQLDALAQQFAAGQPEAPTSITDILTGKGILRY